MTGALPFLLFGSLAAAFSLLLVPAGEGETSPAMVAVDAVKRRLVAHYGAGERGKMLAIAGRTAAEVARTGILAGAGLGAIGFLAGARFLGAWAVVPALALFAAGILVAGKVAENEYRRWQEKLVAGMPDLVNFVPAFLEVTGVTPREALAHSLSFLPEPLKGEMWRVLGPVQRRGAVDEAFDELRGRAKHPLVDAVATRLSAAWDAKVTPELFADLADQVRDAVDLSVTRATAAKGGLLALVCVLGMLGIFMIYGYPGWQYLMVKLGQGVM